MAHKYSRRHALRAGVGIAAIAMAGVQAAPAAATNDVPRVFPANARAYRIAGVPDTGMRFIVLNDQDRADDPGCVWGLSIQSEALLFAALEPAEEEIDPRVMRAWGK